MMCVFLSRFDYDNLKKLTIERQGLSTRVPKMERNFPPEKFFPLLFARALS
jgi:hypothetical protein